MIPRYVRVNTNLWTHSEAVKYFKSKGFEASDPLENQYGVLLAFGLSREMTLAGGDSQRMSTYQTSSFSTPRSSSMKRKLTTQGESSSRIRRPASLRSCWHEIFTNLTETSSMRRQRRETRQLTSVPCWVTKEGSVPL